MFFTSVQFTLAFVHSSTSSESVTVPCADCFVLWNALNVHWNTGVSECMRARVCQYDSPPQKYPPSPLQLCLSWGLVPPSSSSYPSLPPMCTPCPNPFPSRKALIEGAGFSLWPVGAHYCVFISKWGLPDWFNIHVSASYSWPYIHTHSSTVKLALHSK